MNNKNVIKEGMDKMKDYILMQRENELESDKEYKEANKHLNECIQSIRALLPKGNEKLLLELDSAQTIWLVAAGDYLYDAGFRDSLKVIKQMFMESFL